MRCDNPAKSWLLLALLALVLFAFSRPVHGQDTVVPAPMYTISAPELTRLLEISTQLRALSVSLSERLTASQANLTQQESELKALRLELADLRLTIEQSGILSASLKGMLVESESSLSNLMTSFDEYRRAATATIRLWQIVAVGGVLAGIAVAIVF